MVEIVAKLGLKAEVARKLCYRLYAIQTQEAYGRGPRLLVQSWFEIAQLAHYEVKVAPIQLDLL